MVSKGSIRRRPRPARPARSRVPGRGSAPGGPVRARITAAARDRFFALGFHAITMEELARDLGMSKKTIYQQFSSKEAVLDEIIDRLAAELGNVLSELAAPDGRTSQERLRRFLVEVARRLAPIQPVFLESLRRFAPAHLERVEKLRRRNLEQHLTPLLQEGRRRGEVRASIDPAFVVELLLGAIHAMLEPGSLRRLDLTPAGAVSRTLEILLHGIFRESASPSRP